jgi:Fe2+ transport system protein FeoA
MKTLSSGVALKDRTTVTLDCLKVGQVATVVSVDASGALGRRLLELGLVPGCRATVVRHAPLGDPIEVDLRSSLLSLRRYEAALVDMRISN